MSSAVFEPLGHIPGLVGSPARAPLGELPLGLGGGGEPVVAWRHTGVAACRLAALPQARAVVVILAAGLARFFRAAQDPRARALLWCSVNWRDDKR